MKHQLRRRISRQKSRLSWKSREHMKKFICCPFDAIGNLFAFWFEKFPKVEGIIFSGCHFNKLNFTSIERKLKIQSIKFVDCNIPDDISFLNLLKARQIRRIT
eukprot:snap_masked-scaffold_93-processed-gene-0.16-mRNA-1 protein AED:1.00 eAED:1.00 QI:0/0/0/0/1/1/4/0/102